MERGTLKTYSHSKCFLKKVFGLFLFLFIFSIVTLILNGNDVLDISFIDEAIEHSRNTSIGGVYIISAFLFVLFFVIYLSKKRELNIFLDEDNGTIKIGKKNLDIQNSSIKILHYGTKNIGSSGILFCINENKRTSKKWFFLCEEISQGDFFRKYRELPYYDCADMSLDKKEFMILFSFLKENNKIFQQLFTENTTISKDQKNNSYEFLLRMPLYLHPYKMPLLLVGMFIVLVPLLFFPIGFLIYSYQLTNFVIAILIFFATIIIGITTFFILRKKDSKTAIMKIGSPPHSFSIQEINKTISFGMNKHVEFFHFVYVSGTNTGTSRTYSGPSIKVTSDDGQMIIIAGLEPRMSWKKGVATKITKAPDYIFDNGKDFIKLTQFLGCLNKMNAISQEPILIRDID